MGQLGDLFNFGDPDVRNVWANGGPFALVVLYVCFALAKHSSLKRVLGSFEGTFRTFLTQEEAEELKEDSSEVHLRRTFPSLWVTSILSCTASFEACVWMASAMYTLVDRAERDGRGMAGDAWLAGCMVMTWVYAAVVPFMRRKATPNYDLFILYIVLLSGGILVFGGVLYDRTVNDVSLSVVFLVLQSFNLVAILSLIIIELSRPIAIPSNKAASDVDLIGTPRSPEDYTTLWRWLSFSWVYPLIAKGTSATLNENDVWELAPILSTRPVFIKFSNMRQRSLFRWLVVSNALDITLDITLTIVSVLLNFSGPYFLKQILDAIDSTDRAHHAQAYVYACLAFVARLLKAQADLHRLYFSRRAAVRVREELMAAIYAKALKRKDLSGATNLKNEKTAQKGGTAQMGADLGKIVNLMSSDTNRLSIMAQAMNLFYSGVLALVIGCVFLVQLLGWAAFAGFAVLLISWPINSFLTKNLVVLQRRLFSIRDKRMALLNELITSIKFIKFFAWEDHWINRVLQSRAVELAMLVKTQGFAILLKIIASAAPILVSVFAFLTFVAQGHELTVGIAFTSIALFGMIRAPLSLVPEIIVQILQNRVTFERIRNFLFEDEVDDRVSSLKGDHKDSTHSIGLKNARLTWNAATLDKTNKDGQKKSGSSNGTAPSENSESLGSERRFELKDIHLSFPEGHLTVVTGATASGKTALLLSLLGEMTLLDGEILLSKDTTSIDEYGNTRSISYAAQTPWLQHKSIKDNILFGHAYDEVRYDQVLECCALKPDLELFEDGDLTEIGARGVSLSGGQKARVALARAVYNPAKYVLLDDPLSAVDSHTARFLLDRLFFGPLLEHRTVVLVTHHLDLVLPATHYVVKMTDGRIEHQGTVEELRASGILETVSSGSNHTVEFEQEEATKVESTESDGMEKSSQTLKGPEKPARKLITEERREAGGVKWSVYNSYLVASSYWTWSILFLLIAVAQLLIVGEKWWIMKWGEAYSNPSEKSFATFLYPNLRFTSLPSAQERPMFYVGIYALIGALNILVTVSSTIVLILGGLRAARLLFRRLLVGVVHATMRWHDTTPTGRMLNRFGKDIETVDTNLAEDLQSLNMSISTFLSSTIVVSVVFPAFLIPALAIGYIYYALAVGYLNTGRDLRRMEANARSPLFSDFSDILEGIVTVRAFSAERRFLEGFFKKVDLMQKMSYFFWMTNRYLLLRYDALGALAVLITTLLALSGYVTAGLAGLCITSAMAFSENIYWTCRFWTQLELDLNSVERVVEYLDLPQEPPSILHESRPPAHWPSYSGTSDDNLVVIEDLEIRYAPDLPAVLHGISVTLKAGERVGLLGRTGSGKSTLAMSLLRFVEPSQGRIIIDGIDIATIGLHDLRSRLTFIPQDATLFSGTLRGNLDPLDEYSDVECLDALRRVHLISEDTSASTIEDQNGNTHPKNDSSAPLASLANGETKQLTLDTEVSAGGLNFSAGQRQLIALARALLRHSAVIIFDEATSSIDFDTDAKIQSAIREEFNGSLLLTIAHRLNTIIDYDRLLVLDSGKLVEAGTPAELIERDGGIFKEMCLKSGKFDEFSERIQEGRR